MYIGPHRSSGSHNIIVSTHLNSIPASEGVVLPKVGGLTPEGRYIYMDDLLKLDACRPPQAITVPPRVDSINTPLHLEAWWVELKDHPDEVYVRYILSGIKDGFRIGYDYSAHTCASSGKNMQSAAAHPEPIDKYIEEEVSLGRMVGPLDSQWRSSIHISRFGVIPKPHQPGKWRLITDLSSPNGTSINDGIDSQLCSLSYASVDDAVKCIAHLGKGTKLAKFDIASAYRVVPVSPDDRMLLGILWRGMLYVVGALPFGLRSAPKLFTAVADGLLWVMGRHGVSNALHYLDDFLIMGPPHSKECEGALRTSLVLCETLGLPIASHKVEGPATSLAFLGILIDSEAGVLRLPADKLARLQDIIRQWQGKRASTKRDLLSLIGHLSHACRVVKSGRTFLRRMIDLSATPKELHHWVRLNKGFQSDLNWWAAFLEGFPVRWSSSPAGIGDSDVRCIRELGLWGLQQLRCLVSV
jgi:hypothetical protein